MDIKDIIVKGAKANSAQELKELAAKENMPLTDEQAEKLLKESITRSRQIIAAKEKFNASISTLLTPRQIMRIHQIDSSFRHRIRDIYDARRPGLKGKDNIKHK